MSRWTTEEDERLRELAADGLSAAEIARALPPRTEASVYGRASKLKVALTSGQHRGLRDYLADGGKLVRDGVVGIRWARATRSGESYPTRTCERLAALGFLRPTDRENVFGRA